MKVGVICSAGGSVIRSVIDSLGKTNCFFESIVVLTDRQSPILNYCQENQIQNALIPHSSNAQFSVEASDLFNKAKVSIVLLYFSRLVTESIYKQFPTFNFHPSLLPSYSGFNAIERAIEGNARFLGATVHGVDETVDSGLIVGQIVCPILSADRAYLYKLSYLQKVYLSFSLLELIYDNNIDLGSYKVSLNVSKSLNANPFLTHLTLVYKMREFEAKEGITIF